jgi:hypothetical protein
MFLSANPDKARPEAEREEMNHKYASGDKVLPKLKLEDKTPAQRRLEEQERALLAEVQEISLREAVMEGSSGTSSRSRTRRRPEENPQSDGTPRGGTNTSGDTPRRDARERSRRRTALNEDNRREAEQSATMHPDIGGAGERRQLRAESGQRAAVPSESRRRYVEHQSSLRSLISSSDVDSRDMEREIEEFARQIQAEGLLDGLDLENIDLVNNGELSRKITEAYRRRQRERSRHQPARRSDASVADRIVQLANPMRR